MTSGKRGGRRNAGAVDALVVGVDAKSGYTVVEQSTGRYPNNRLQ